MEEVDRIIIHTLKDIGCAIEEDVRSLGEFSTQLVFEASVRCVEIIMPDIRLPRNLPENMAARFQHSASIAEGCKRIGYKGEIGYQTFLYSNVVELRKVLMFLIDKLPRETDKTTPAPQDALSKTKGMIASVLRTQLSERMKADEVKSVPFVAVNIETGITHPGKNTNMNPQEWREFCRNELDWLTDQCEATELYSSVCRLMDTQEMSDTESATKTGDGRPKIIKPKPRPRSRLPAQSGPSFSSWLALRAPLPTPRQKITSEEKAEDIKENHVDVGMRDSSSEDKEMILAQEIDHCNNRVAESQLALQVLNDKLTQLKGELNEMSGDKMKQVEARQRAAALLCERDETIVSDAMRKVAERKDKLAMLNKQWQAHSQPLIDSISQITQRTSGKKSEEEKQLTRLEELNEQIDEMNQQISLKGVQKAKLEAELAKAPKEIHRSMYTQRILEIIGSIKKQKDDIDKILKDTRQVQKEISLTSGKLERCFTVVDELIFKNAKRDEHSRRAYKMLATLHADCSDIVTYIRETGALVREISDVQEQIETESNKKVGASLQRITDDLKQMKSETELLKIQLETLSK